MVTRGANLVKRADRWAAFRLQAVLMLVCGGCGSSDAGPASDGGVGETTDSGHTVEGGTDAAIEAAVTDAKGVLDAPSGSSDAGAPNVAVDAGTCSGGMRKSGTVVLFAGMDATFPPITDTWTFDGTSWTQVPVSNPPSARLGAMMATLGNEVVLFGGMASTEIPLGDAMTTTFSTDVNDTLDVQRYQLDPSLRTGIEVPAPA
jgi:hypothetical protein